HPLSPPTSRLSLHDALPISSFGRILIEMGHKYSGFSPPSRLVPVAQVHDLFAKLDAVALPHSAAACFDELTDAMRGRAAVVDDRSEEHTSELQSHLNLVCRL